MIRVAMLFNFIVYMLAVLGSYIARMQIIVLATNGVKKPHNHLKKPA